MSTDGPGDALALQCAEIRARAEGSRALAALARKRSDQQAQYARAAAVRAHEHAARNVNAWPTARGLVSARRGQLDDDVLCLILDAACSLFPECGSVSLTVVDQLGEDGRPLRTAAATGVARSLDEAQYLLGQGPCIEAVELDMVAVVHAHELAAPGERPCWPEFALAAGDMGVRSAMSVGVPWSPFSVGLHPEERALGAINFYDSAPHPVPQLEPYATMLSCWAGAMITGREPVEILDAGR